MPVPSTINDIYTTAGSNPPGGGETPAEGDNHLRAAYSFIATLRDILNGTSSSTATIQTLLVSGASAFTGAATFNGNVTIGNAGSDLLSIAAATNMAGTLTAQATATFEDVVTFDANPAGRVTGNTYTPTLTNAGNVTASTARVCQYMRAGPVVTVSGQLDVQPTSGVTGTTIYISLPIASAMTTAYSLSGVGALENGSSSKIPVRIEAEPTNDVATCRFVPSSTSNNTMSFTFTYLVI